VNPLAKKVSNEELKQLLGDIHTEVKVGGKTLDIKPLDLSQIADALESVEHLSSMIGTGDFKQMLSKLALRGGHNLIELLRIATREELDWVRGLNALDAIKLAKAVYQVNVDFFGQNAAEMKEVLGPLWELAENWISKAGQEQSSDSSATATSAKESGTTHSRRSASSAGQ
jgi:hypothetical protein